MVCLFCFESLEVEHVTFWWLKCLTRIIESSHAIIRLSSFYYQKFIKFSILGSSKKDSLSLWSSWCTTSCSWRWLGHRSICPNTKRWKIIWKRLIRWQRLVETLMWWHLNFMMLLWRHLNFEILLCKLQNIRTILWRHMNVKNSSVKAPEC